MSVALNKLGEVVPPNKLPTRHRNAPSEATAKFKTRGAKGDRKRSTCAWVDQGQTDGREKASYWVIVKRRLQYGKGNDQYK